MKESRCGTTNSHTIPVTAADQNGLEAAKNRHIARLARNKTTCAVDKKCACKGAKVNAS